MKLLVLIVVVLVVVAVAFVVARAAQGRATRGARWELEERSERGRVVVRAVRGPGAEPLLVGAVAFDDPDFELRIEELRSEGRSRLIALNSGR